MPECYNMIAEEEYEDPRNINIPETEGHRKVEGLQIEDPFMSVAQLIPRSAR